MSKKHNAAPVNEIDETIKASTSFIEKHFKTIAVATCGVLAAIIICLVVNQYYIQPNKIEAADNIAVAQQHFQQGMYEQALNGDGTNLGFLQIIEQYGSTPSGNIARLYAGLCYANTDRAEEAVKYLEDYDQCDDMMVSNASIAALGNVYAQLGQNEKAADTLLKAAKRANSTTLSPLFYLQAGQLYESLGNKDKALEMQKIAYDQLMKEGIQGLHYLSYDEIALPLDGTVEGSHASDHGMVAYADAYEKKLRDILNEPVGEYVTTVPVVQQRDPYIWMDRHAHILREGAGKHFDRVIIGDSIMHFWGGADDAPARNGQKVWDEFEGATLNMGCGYDKTENVLWRIYHGQLDDLTADRIFLTIGINNVATGRDNKEIVEGISMILSAILSRRPEAELTLMGVFPCRGREGRVKDINQELKALARNKGVRFENPGRKLLKNGKIDESLCTDGLHPNEEGYRLIASYYR